MCVFIDVGNLVNVDYDQVALSRNSRDFNRTINQPRIRTGSGVFYTGMTLQDAKMMGRDKCLLRRDFSNVDKNKDWILTNDEILKERDNEVKRLKFDALLSGALALWDGVATIKKFSIWNAVFATLFGLMTVDSISRHNKLKAANEELKQQLNIDV